MCLPIGNICRYVFIHIIEIKEKTVVNTRNTAGSSLCLTDQINKAGLFTGFYKHRLYCVIAKTAERVSHHLSGIMGNDMELPNILNFLQEGRNNSTL